MTTVAVARYAMATRFEIVLHGQNQVSLRAAAEEALDEIERLEAQLSLYQPTSQIAEINARAAFEPVRVDPFVFRFLQEVKQIAATTGGTFDVTIGPLMRCWGFMRDSGHLPDPDELAEARGKVGLHLVQLDPASNTVRFERSGMMLDLGAVGKGYAIECAVERLREAGVESAIIHGGTSTVYGLGRPPGAQPWIVAVEYPPAPGETTGPLLTAVALENEALSVSAVWGKSFQSDNRTLGHVLDPRTGEPTDQALLAAVVLPSATKTDAWSTALLVEGKAGIERLARLEPTVRALVLRRGDDGSGFQTHARGVTIRPWQG